MPTIKLIYESISNKYSGETVERIIPNLTEDDIPIIMNTFCENLADGASSIRVEMFEKQDDGIRTKYLNIPIYSWEDSENMTIHKKRFQIFRLTHIVVEGRNEKTIN